MNVCCNKTASQQISNVKQQNIYISLPFKQHKICWILNEKKNQALQFSMYTINNHKCYRMFSAKRCFATNLFPFIEIHTTSPYTSHYHITLSQIEVHEKQNFSQHFAWLVFIINVLFCFCELEILLWKAIDFIMPRICYTL
jgi:hypothetical protein